MTYVFHFIIFTIFILFLIVVIFTFSIPTTKLSSNNNTQPLLQSLPSINNYQMCHDPFGNIRYDIWYDTELDRTVTLNKVGSTGLIVAKSGIQYVYELSSGKNSCF